MKFNNDDQDRVLKNLSSGDPSPLEKMIEEEEAQERHMEFKAVLSNESDPAKSTIQVGTAEFVILAAMAKFGLYSLTRATGANVEGCGEMESIRRILRILSRGSSPEQMSFDVQACVIMVDSVSEVIGRIIGLENPDPEVATKVHNAFLEVVCEKWRAAK